MPTKRPNKQEVIAMKRAVIARGDAWVCCWCEKPFDVFTIPETKEKVPHCTLEHLIPLASGGPHELDNCALACAACNHKRPAFSPKYKPNPIVRKFVQAKPPVKRIDPDARGMESITRILSLSQT